MKQQIENKYAAHGEENKKKRVDNQIESLALGIDLLFCCESNKFTCSDK